MLEKITTVMTGVKTVLYLFCAIMAFICVYPLYSLISQLEMTTMARVTIALVFWIIAYTVVYQTTIWIYQGRDQHAT